MPYDQRDERKIRQISLGLSVQVGELTAAEIACEKRKVADLSDMQASLLSITPRWPHKFHLQACPYPMVVPEKLLYDLSIFHKSLDAAITNIVERWWTDEGACFPNKMPLESQVEEILRWMDDQSEEWVPKYRKCQGSWRPDFLLDANENFRMCEINARFPFNLLLHTAFCQQAYIDMDNKTDPLTTPGAQPAKIYNSLFRLFDPSSSLHLLKGTETGLDIHQFVSYIQLVTGRKPLLLEPSELRLVDDRHSPTGFALHCVIGVDIQGNERLERIYQVGLELTQHELRSLSPAMLREISRCCFNDFRTIFLVHDKRMLGIVLQELNNLVEVQKILTVQQADVLRRGIAPTMIPGSREIANLLSASQISPGIRKDFVIKPIGGGKGDGIIFGSDTTPASWISQLERMQRSELLPGDKSCVVQRRIEQPKFGVVLDSSNGVQQNYLVGTYLSIHGGYQGLGPWRISPDRICALSAGGWWVGSVLPAKKTFSVKPLNVKARL
ncbi:hypothetical protein ACLMJK_009456 [Lecanora helva]